MTRYFSARRGQRRGGVGRGRAERVPEPHRPAQRVPARGHRDRRRAVLRRLDPDRRRVPRQPPHRQGAVVVQAPARPRCDRDEGRPRTALRRRVAATADRYVYDAKSGALHVVHVREASFVNDVVVTKRRAWFTDSFKPVLYRVPLGPNGRPRRADPFRSVTLPATTPGHLGFNVNGIDATPNGKTSSSSSRTREALHHRRDRRRPRDRLAGGESVPNSDGILLDGKTLYVVQNRWTSSRRSRSRRASGAAASLRRISDPRDLDFPTTIAEQGSRALRRERAVRSRRRRRDRTGSRRSPK